MTKQLVDIGPAMKEIRDTSKTFPRIDPAEVAAALGAEPIPDAQVVPGSPLALMVVRQEMARRAQASGGRPATSGTALPLSDKELKQLEAVAAAVAGPGGAPSAGQVASVLLNLALDSVLADHATGNAKLPITQEQLRQRLADVVAKS